jgi:hypothetical protein
MAVNHFAVTPPQAGDSETKFYNRGAHAVHDRIIFARVVRVWGQFVDRPRMDFHYVLSGQSV